ncbi:hypothetical protein CCB81_04210 [Armatimonadetes bacterium Uphvl-Ar2]|nr:hypothetical protein CCB81_04210 [Armatimonadetes bacterium Uphvl-Ar2]
MKREYHRKALTDTTGQYLAIEGTDHYFVSYNCDDNSGFWNRHDSIECQAHYLIHRIIEATRANQRYHCRRTCISTLLIKKV